MLADFHCNTRFMTLAHLSALVNQTNALFPDLILLLGDYAGHVAMSGELAPSSVAEQFSKLQAPMGTHAVFGNHDWYSDSGAKKEGRLTKWHTAFEDAGIKTYSNTGGLFETAAPIALAGLESQRALHKGRESKVDGLDDWPGLSEALNPDVFTILMAHEPDIFPDLPDWVDLTLSGHTHGGQIAPFGKALFVPSRYGTRYAYGHFKEGSKQLIVSGGLGYSKLPIRIGRPPEIVMVSLA
ncbi:MAG: metallophosphoesterase [Paracoccaceae bacterium]